MTSAIHLAGALASAYAYYKYLQKEGEDLARKNGYTNEDAGFGQSMGSDSIDFINYTLHLIVRAKNNALQPA